MKVNLSAKEKKEFGHYLQALSENIDEGDYFNDILYMVKPVKEQKKPYRIVKLSTNEYLDNPYYRTIKTNKKKEGNIYLSYDKYSPHQGFVYDEIKLNKEYFREKTPFGFFEEEFSFLSLKEKNTTWMSITPHEINTMKKPIDEVSGNVATLGLGLGYFAFMTSMKDNVSSVTIVDNNKTIIDVFKKQILPSFPNKEKIKIIEEDALEYVEKMEHIDYIFADIWHMPEDGLPLYSKLLKYEEIKKSTAFSYWIENSILSLIRRALIILIDEEMQGSEDENYLDEETFSDHLINQIHFILKSKEISSIKDIRDLLNFQSLKNIAKKIEF